MAISLPLILLGSEILSFQQGPLCFCHLVEAWQSPNQAGHLFALRLPVVYNSCGHFLDDLVSAPSVSITVRKSLCHKEWKESPQTLIQYTLLSCVVPRMSWEVCILTEDPCGHYFRAISTFPLPLLTVVMFSPAIVCLPKINAWRDGSSGKGASHQARFSHNSPKPHGGRREPTRTNCRWSPHCTHIHRYIYNELNNIFNFKKTK